MGSKQAGENLPNENAEPNLTQAHAACATPAFLPPQPVLTDTPAEPGHHAQDTNPGTSRCRVLVVDDDPAVAESTVLLLQVVGHDVRSAANGEEALELARSFRPQLVLLDIGLRGMDGYEVARRIREEKTSGEELRLMAVTGYGQEEDRTRSMAAGFDRHLVKPVPPDALCELVDEIGRLLANRTPGG